MLPPYCQASERVFAFAARQHGSGWVGGALALRSSSGDTSALSESLFRSCRQRCTMSVSTSWGQCDTWMAQLHDNLRLG